MFITQKKLQARIDEAIAKIPAVSVPDHSAEIVALRDEVATLRADYASRADALERDFAARLSYEREKRDEMESRLWAMLGEVRQEILALPSPDPRLQGQAQEIREIADTVQYILEAPSQTVTTVVHAPASPAIPWAKQMGAR